MKIIHRRLDSHPQWNCLMHKLDLWKVEEQDASLPVAALQRAHKCKRINSIGFIFRSCTTIVSPEMKIKTLAKKRYSSARLKAHEQMLWDAGYASAFALYYKLWLSHVCCFPNRMDNMTSYWEWIATLNCVINHTGLVFAFSLTTSGAGM